MDNPLFNTLTTEQKYAFWRFMSGENLFFTGAGGTGKSYFLKILVELQSTMLPDKTIKVCAMTGFAATLLDCTSSTLHSWAGLTISEISLEDHVNKIRGNYRLFKNWKSVDCLIIDEVSMLSDNLFERLDQLGRALRKGKTHLPFGGIQVLLFGDFFQLPPIQGLFCFLSPYWNGYFPPSQCIRFNVVFRQKDERYIRLLNHVRQGELTTEDAELLESRVHQEYAAGRIPTKLFATRRQVDETNSQMFDALKGEIISYAATVLTDCTSFKDGSSTALSSENIEKGAELSEAQKEREIDDLFKQQGYKESLQLKVGAAIMCTSNIDVANGICNGSQGIIETMDATGPIVLFHNQIRMRIPKVFRHSTKYPTIAVGQYPLHLAWAITIHKIQGASIELAEMDLGSNIFECGQSYVALSRVKSLEGLFLMSFDQSKIKSDPHVVAFERNIPSLDESEMQAYIERAIAERSLTKRISMSVPITAFFKKQKS